MYFPQLSTVRNTEMKGLVKETETHVIILLFGFFLLLLLFLFLSCKIHKMVKIVHQNMKNSTLPLAGAAPPAGAAAAATGAAPPPAGMEASLACPNQETC